MFLVVLSVTNASLEAESRALLMPSLHPQGFDEHVPFRHPLKEKLFATELAMEFIAPFKLSWKVPKYMCNIMQIWCLLMSWFFE